MSLKEGVSVVIPVYKDFSFLEKVIESVFISCKGLDFEVIIVDDCSDNVDFLLYLNKKYHDIKLIINEEKGNAAKSRNIGFDASEYRFIFFLDSDDFFTEGHVSNRINLHKKECQGFIFGQFITLYKDKKIYSMLKQPKSNLCDYLFFEKGDVRTSTFSLDKKNLKTNMYFDDLSFKHQDWIFACLADKEYFFDEQHGVMINVMHGSNMSMTFNLSASQYFIDNYLKSAKLKSAFSKPNCINSVVANDRKAYDFFMSYFKPYNKNDVIIKVLLQFYRVPVSAFCFHKFFRYLKNYRWS